MAERQHGVAARSQLLALGLSRHEIDGCLACGYLVRLHRGVYALGHRVLTHRGDLMAAVLAMGPRAVLSHKSAASLHDLLMTSQTRVDVTVPGSRGAPRRRGLRIRVTQALHPEDVTTIDGIPVTSVARTIVDLAGVLNPGQLQRAIEQADREGVLNLLALQRALDRNRGFKGRARLRALLAEYTGAPPTKSELERRFLELVDRAGLPRPGVNVRVAGIEVDCYWPDWSLVIELDSRAFHSDPRAFERDPIRDARLQRQGLRVLRVTWKRLENEPDAVIEDVLALASLSGGSGGRLELGLAKH